MHQQQSNESRNNEPLRTGAILEKAKVPETCLKLVSCLCQSTFALGLIVSASSSASAFV